MRARVGRLGESVLEVQRTDKLIATRIHSIPNILHLQLLIISVVQVNFWPPIHQFEML